MATSRDKNVDSGYAELSSAARVVARFLCEYHKIWQDNFPGLNKRAHWNVIFAAKTADVGGVSCRAIHRVLYGSYGTDIRTCIERIKDCERDGFIRVFDDAERPCPASSGCLIGATPKLHQAFDRHCRETIGEIGAVFAHPGRAPGLPRRGDDAAVADAIFRFFGAYDQKWRETSEAVVREKGLTPAYFNDAMDHLVTYQYWAIVMLLWSASPFGSDRGTPALVIDEIISRMWDALGLGHLAIKERVGNLTRWGFFAEQTIKKHKAVRLTPFAGEALGQGLAETKPLLEELHQRLTARPAPPVAAQIA